jgi:hypothetical protein
MLSFDMGPRFSAEKNLQGAAFRLSAPQIRLKLAAETFNYIWLGMAAGEPGRNGTGLKACCDKAAPPRRVVLGGVIPVVADYISSGE